MAEEEVKLLGWWLSPFSRRVETALKMKGVSYEYIEEDLFNKSPLLLQYNPIHQKVPVLLHNGKPILESLVILEYIDETWKGNPILPEDPHDRAIARFWAKFIDEKCLLSTWNACWSKGEEQEKAKKEAYECLKTLEGALRNKKFFGGDTIGLVDIAGNSIAYWVRDIQEIVGIELFTAEKFPVLFKWSEEFIECPVIKKNLPPRDKLIAAFKARFEEGKWYK